MFAFRTPSAILGGPFRHVMNLFSLITPYYRPFDSTALDNPSGPSYIIESETTTRKTATAASFAGPTIESLRRQSIPKKNALRFECSTTRKTLDDRCRSAAVGCHLSDSSKKRN
ncbi:hypothetical protein GWI33_014921 [Rhynchophorus ferrugineus]|uniref:Uncharacterized protein n=1 Tax=Rhynchophorus ferrugineus TaxID=354439 RepID=A0A834MA83_RHYFE|nr:hypothetical protein GWI33_014921 [Rhynchophorus ferrugineus]